MYEAVLRAWGHGGVPLPQYVGEASLDGRNAVVAGRGYVQVAERAVQYDVLRWGDACGEAASRSPIAVGLVAVHCLDSLSEAGQHRFGAGRVAFQ